MTDHVQDAVLTSDVVAAVARVMDLHPRVICGQIRTRPAVMARWVCWRIGRERGWSLSKCGGMTGNRDHTTVLYGVDRLAREMADETVLGLAARAVLDAANARLARKRSVDLVPVEPCAGPSVAPIEPEPEPLPPRPLRQHGHVNKLGEIICRDDWRPHGL